MIRFKHKKMLLSASTSGFALALASAALAQQAPTSASPSLVQEVVVTANKREEKLKDVAQAVTVVSQAKLEQLQASNFEDYAKLIPGLDLNTTKPGQTVLILRGLSSLSAGSTVGVYVDDTPYGSSSGLGNGQFYTADLNSFDLKRVEVLQGPQGTLYGASTLGGLLKFVTNPPNLKSYEALVQGTAESVDGSFGYSTKAMVNIPIAGDAAFRLDAVHSDDPGFIDDPYRRLSNINGARQTAFRASALYEPTDRLSIRATAVSQDSTYDGSNEVDVKFNVIGQPLMPYQPVTGNLQSSHTFPEFTHTRYRVYNTSIDYKLGWATLTSSTSFSTLNQVQQVDISELGTVRTDNGVDQSKITEEVRLTSNPGRYFDWTAGVYYTREVSEIDAALKGVCAPFYCAIAAVQLDGSHTRVDSTYREGAAFGTLTYHLTPRFDVTAGGRYARNDQGVDEVYTGLFAQPSHVGKSSEDVFLYSVAARWRPDDRSTLYSRVASGYRPGGPNVYPFGNPNQAPPNFEADTVTSGEVGYRRDLFGDRLSLDLSAFYLHWNKIQLIGTVTVNNIAQQATLNGGAADSKGLQGVAILRPLTGLVLTLNGAYTDTELTKDTPANVGGLKGDPLPYVPKWASTLDASYRWPIRAGTEAFVGGTVGYVGDRRSSFGPQGSFSQQVRIPDYATVDLRAGIEVSRWTLELYAKNLSNERGVTGIGINESAPAVSHGANPAGVGDTVSIIRPRTIGVSLIGRF